MKNENSYTYKFESQLEINELSKTEFLCVQIHALLGKVDEKPFIKVSLRTLMAKILKLADIKRQHVLEAIQLLKLRRVISQEDQMSRPKENLKLREMPSNDPVVLVLTENQRAEIVEF